jgi:hypothetical protein
MAKEPSAGILPAHGAGTLPSVDIDSSTLEIEDEEGFIGDTAN